MPTEAALEAAEQAGLDLVEVSPNADPPVCKIVDYGKLKYQDQKKKAEAKKKQKTVEIKEIKMRPNIDIHDYQVKTKAMHRFFEAGDKVKVTKERAGYGMKLREAREGLKDFFPKSQPLWRGFQHNFSRSRVNNTTSVS